MQRRILTVENSAHPIQDDEYINVYNGFTFNFSVDKQERKAKRKRKQNKMEKRENIQKMTREKTN